MKKNTLTVIGIFLLIFGVPFLIESFRVQKFLNTLNRISDKSFSDQKLTQEEINNVSSYYNYYGGDVKAINTGQFLCQLIKERYPLPPFITVNEVTNREYLDGYLGFYVISPFYAGFAFSNGELYKSLSYTEDLFTIVDDQVPENFDVLSSAIFAASVEVYCPKYKFNE